MAFKNVLPILVLVAVLLPLLGTTDATRELGEKTGVAESKNWYVPKFCYEPSPNTLDACVECRTICSQKSFIGWAWCYPRCCHCASSGYKKP